MLMFNLNLKSFKESRAANKDVNFCVLEERKRDLLVKCKPITDLKLKKMESMGLRDHPVKMLECPICYNVFQYKIFMCTKGHNICDTCRPNVENCPVCRSEFTGTRNHLVEQLLSLPYTCKNNEYGCSEKLPLNKIQIHQKCCNYRSYECFVPECPWHGQCADLKTHIISKHAPSVATSKEILFSDRNYSNTEKEHNDYLFIELYNEVFAYFYKRETTGKLLFDVLYLGPKDNAENFRYMLAFQNENRSKKMQLVSNVSSDEKSKFSESCLSLDYSTCKQFIRYNGNLQYFLTIEKQGCKRNMNFEVLKDRTYD